MAVPPRIGIAQARLLVNHENRITCRGAARDWRIADSTEEADTPGRQTARSWAAAPHSSRSGHVPRIGPRGNGPDDSVWADAASRLEPLEGLPGERKKREDRPHAKSSGLGLRPSFGVWGAGGSGDLVVSDGVHKRKQLRGGQAAELQRSVRCAPVEVPAGIRRLLDLCRGPPQRSVLVVQKLQHGFCDAKHVHRGVLLRVPAGLRLLLQKIGPLLRQAEGLGQGRGDSSLEGLA